MVTAVENEKIGDLILAIGELRRKQMDPTHNGGKGLTDDECREGIRLLAQVRVMRAGKSASPDNASQSLADMF